MWLDKLGITEENKNILMRIDEKENKIEIVKINTGTNEKMGLDEKVKLLKDKLKEYNIEIDVIIADNLVRMVLRKVNQDEIISAKVIFDKKEFKEKSVEKIVIEILKYFNEGKEKK